MVISKVGRRGQVTLPREIRRQANIKDGDLVAFMLHGDRVILQPLGRTLMDLRGSVPVSSAQDFEAIRRQVVGTHAQQVARDDD